MNKQKTDEPWVEELRAQFPVTKKLAYFDIAYENCGADFAHDAVEEYFQDKVDLYKGMEKAGGSGKGKTISVMDEARECLARFLNAPGMKNLAFTANTCQAINLALQSLSLQPGDNVVVGNIEHVCVLMPCLQLKKKGIDCRVVMSKDGLSVTVEDLLSSVDERTRAIAVSYVQSSSGYKVDLKRLCEECHKRGILVITDAIQALGFQEIDVQALGVDALAASGYKGMLATEGEGFLYCSDAFLAQAEPVLGGPSPAVTIDRENWEIRVLDPLDARKLESGTIPFASIYGLRAGVNRMLEIGMDKIEAHISECFEQVYKGLEQLGYRLATPFESAHRCHSMLVCTGKNKEMVDFFFEHGVFFSRGKDGYVRISIAPFTSRQDMERLFEAAKEWLPNEEA